MVSFQILTRIHQIFETGADSGKKREEQRGGCNDQELMFSGRHSINLKAQEGDGEESVTTDIQVICYSDVLEKDLNLCLS